MNRDGMSFFKVLEKVLTAFAEMDLAPESARRTRTLKLINPEQSCMGAYADIVSDGSACLDLGPGQTAIVRTLVIGNDEVADAILHAKDGRLSCIEIALYDAERPWGSLLDAVLR